MCFNGQVTIELQTKTFSVEVDIDPADGKIHEERWRDETGAYNRPGDLPAIIEYCAKSGLPSYMRWFNGQGCHRENDMPSVVLLDLETDTELALDYFILGKQHREGDKPASILKTPEGKFEQESYWKYGKCHRDPELGPAQIFYDIKTGEIARTEYWVNGIQLMGSPVQSSLDI